MPLTLLLVVQRQEARRRYLAEAQPTGAHIDAVDTLDGFLSAVTHRAYHGLIIDVRSKINLFGSHGDLILSVCRRYPVILVNFDSERGNVRALLFGQHQARGRLPELIEQHCRTHRPETFRAHRRQATHFNVRLALEAAELRNETAIHTVTLDVSRGGCFLFFAGPDIQGKRVWLEFIELDDPSPIEAEVRRQIPWGTPMRIPGIGLAFIEASEAQIQNLCEAPMPPAAPVKGLEKATGLENER